MPGALWWELAENEAEGREKERKRAVNMIHVENTGGNILHIIQVTAALFSGAVVLGVGFAAGILLAFSL